MCTLITLFLTFTAIRHAPLGKNWMKFGEGLTPSNEWESFFFLITNPASLNASSISPSIFTVVSLGYPHPREFSMYLDDADAATGIEHDLSGPTSIPLSTSALSTSGLLECFHNSSVHDPPLRIHLSLWVRLFLPLSSPVFFFSFLPLKCTTAATKPISHRSLMMATAGSITPATNFSRRFSFFDMRVSSFHQCSEVLPPPFLLSSNFLRLHFTCTMSHFCSATEYPRMKVTWA